jgi:uncharacterized membrane protein YfcA
MPAFDLWRAAVAFGAAFVAGAINSIAGGGTLVSFPTLIWLGLPPVIANATNTVAVWPGSLGGMWGYRRELADSRSGMFAFIAPSIIGGVTGALLLRLTPAPLFNRLVPFLILFATLLFLAQEPLQKRFAPDPGQARSRAWFAGGMLFQLGVAIYGGYFGAGIGILMLAALALLGVRNIHEMNGLKNLFALCINGAAAIYFMVQKMVDWPNAILMAIAAILGGWACARVARKLSRVAVRRIVVAIGFGMAASLLWKSLM